MATHEMNYNCSEIEFEEMRNLLVRSYLKSRRPFNWRLAMAENWYYASRYLEPIEYFTSHAHLWRNDTGELVGFLFHYYSMIHLQVNYEYRHLESEMVDWAERNWAGGESQINTMVYEWDIERQKLLASRGYENHGAMEDVRIYDLTRIYPEVDLPPGFRITSLAEYGDARARVDLENSVFGATLDENWYRGKSSAPSYSPNWDLIAISPDGKLAAESLVWLYPKNQAAEIDPLGTHPDFRKQGLARAIVLESFKRMCASGIRYAYIASEAQNSIVSHLYATLQPVETYQGFHWNKQL
jgi:ribosomal protein S18 acetylase RimI-like enzyme